MSADMTSNLVDRPRYLFLMRDADHREGRVTKDGSARVRALAGRLSEWVRAEWRDQQDRTIRLWYTTQATEVLETIDLLMEDVLAEMQHHRLRASYPFGLPMPEEVNHLQSWMARLLPSFSVTRKSDLGQLSAYSPDRETFKQLCEWLGSTKIGDDQARRTHADAQLLVGNDPLMGGWPRS